MYKWQTIFNDFHKAQMLVGRLENQVTLTREEDGLWTTVNDYSPAQREYEDKHYKPKKDLEMPF